MTRRRCKRRRVVRDRIAGTLFHLELFRSEESDGSIDWSGGVLIGGSVRIELSAEHASNLTRRMRAAVDQTICRSLCDLPGIGQTP